MKKYLCIGLLVFFGFLQIDAQDNRRKPGDLLQFSGVVVSGDSLQPVPFTAIMVKGTYRGTLSDYYGFFSFVAQEGDTIEFSVLGFQKSTYILPDSLDGSRYSIIQVLNQDTIMLPMTVIYPWPTKEQIYEYFLKAPVPDDDLERARKNLAQETIVDMAMTIPMDATMNYRNSMSQYNTRLYNAGQIPMNNLLNPIAWAKFVQAWKKGDFKKKTTR
jgi:hypothetical protein